MAFPWLPKIAYFFSFLARLIEDSERQLNSASYDSIGFLVRRLGEYERTLATLTSSFCETYGCVPAQQNTAADLSYLCNRAFLRSNSLNNEATLSWVSLYHPQTCSWSNL